MMRLGQCGSDSSCPLQPSSEGDGTCMCVCVGGEVEENGDKCLYACGLKLDNLFGCSFLHLC